MKSVYNSFTKKSSIFLVSRIGFAVITNLVTCLQLHGDRE